MKRFLIHLYRLIFNIAKSLYEQTSAVIKQQAETAILQSATFITPCLPSMNPPFLILSAMYEEM